MKKDSEVTKTKEGDRVEDSKKKRFPRKKMAIIGMVLLGVLFGGVLSLLALLGGGRVELASLPLVDNVISNSREESLVGPRDYINQKYGYLLQVPDNWTLIAEAGEKDLKEEVIKGIHVEVGANVILARGTEINPEELESNPAVALTIIRSDSKINHKIAQWFGFGDSLVKVEEYFNDKELEGKKYVEGSPGEENYGWLAIYRNVDQNLYYVLNLNFATTNHNTIKEVRGIADSFELQ